MIDSSADDVEDSGFPEDFDDESPDVTSNEEDTSYSYKSERSFKVERHSRASSTDLSVTTRSDGSKCNSRFSYNENVQSAESQYHLLELLSNSGFPMTQINGQRKLGPPPGWTQPPPDPSCEVFVGKIPRNLFENEIYPVFVKMGEIYEIRLMMSFAGTTRGYCFVMFTKSEYAKRAIEELNNYPIRPGRKIGVVASVNNCRLSIGQLPSNIDPEIVIKKFYEMTDEVSKVAVYKYPNGQVRSALVSYDTHRAAAMARRRLLPERGNLFANVEVSVDWAQAGRTFNYMVEVNGVRDESGKLEITESTTSSYSKRRGSFQRRAGNEFLEKSIKNYLREKSSSQYPNQSRSSESSLYSQKSSARGGSVSWRRKGNRTSETRSFDLEQRGSKKENYGGNHWRSLSIPQRENVGNDDLRFADNRDINGNISKNSRGLLKVSVDFDHQQPFDCSKMPSPSIIGGHHEGARGPFRILTAKGSLNSPLNVNVLEHYGFSPNNKLETGFDQNNRDRPSDAAVWRGSANPTESCVSRAGYPLRTEDGSRKAIGKQQNNSRATQENGIQGQPKVMPNFWIVNPFANFNLDHYASQQPNPAQNYALNGAGNYCQHCASRNGSYQHQTHFPGQNFALMQTPHAPQHDGKFFNGNFENQEASIDSHGRLTEVPYQPPLFSTSSFANYLRFIPQIYPNQTMLRPRPILNRPPATTAHNN